MVCLSGNQPYFSYMKLEITMSPVFYGKHKDKNPILVIIIVNIYYLLNRLHL